MGDGLYLCMIRLARFERKLDFHWTIDLVRQSNLEPLWCRIFVIL